MMLIFAFLCMQQINYTTYQRKAFLNKFEHGKLHWRRNKEESHE
ncbi:hypothetical protein S101395_00355 [Bacillus sonorensis]|uniref:Transposase n=1 Tax=Bacillus sonorensis TaxID=119858 RepID=A0ABM6LC78_9BACI|nr:hypothetical protein S101395_00355 [Bacillus sonorensis]TWK80820.1 hypothetical protein CHCC20335_0774 [Bacillus paralicheniformis]